MMRFHVPDLPYALDALAPAISKEIMELHHGTHHAAYVAKLNDSVSDLNLPDTWDELAVLEQVFTDLEGIPESVRTAVRNNGGGHYNHSLFWKFMTPTAGDIPSPLRQAIEARYGSLDEFKDQFTQKALGLFGSGWVWLQPSLDLIALPNQDNPLMNGGQAPILGLDVWEHAYYLDYHASRKDYVDAWWGVVNWDFVNERYESMNP